MWLLPTSGTCITITVTVICILLEVKPGALLVLHSASLRCCCYILVPFRCIYPPGLVFSKSGGSRYYLFLISTPDCILNFCNKLKSSHTFVQFLFQVSENPRDITHYHDTLVLLCYPSRPALFSQ